MTSIILPTPTTGHANSARLTFHALDQLVLPVATILPAHRQVRPELGLFSGRTVIFGVLP